MDEQFDAVNVGLDEIRASIGDLDGRSVASRLISMGVDIGNLAVRQDAVESRLTAVETRLDGMDTRLDGMDTRLEGMDTRLEGMDGRLETVASGVTEILQILRNP